MAPALAAAFLAIAIFPLDARSISGNTPRPKNYAAAPMGPHSQARPWTTVGKCEELSKEWRDRSWALTMRLLREEQAMKIVRIRCRGEIRAEFILCCLALWAAALAPQSIARGEDGEEAAERVTISANSDPAAARVVATDMDPVATDKDTGAEPETSAEPEMALEEPEAVTPGAASPKPATTADTDALAPIPASTPTSPQPKLARTESEDSLSIVADVATFKDIQPGNTSRDEMIAAWGQPTEMKTVEGGSRYTYDIAPFQKVIVAITGETVTAIVIHLDKPVAPETLAKLLEIDGVVAVRVSDEKGKSLGEAYPERGVLFAYQPEQTPPRVVQVVLEPIDAQPFLLRAELRCRNFPAHSLADADFALTLDAKSHRAHWLRAQSLAGMGKFIEALQAAQVAVDAAPDEPVYRLTTAKLMITLGDYEHAEKILKELTGGKSLPPLVEARAYCQLGDCLCAATQNNNQQAMQFHQQAIRLSEALATNEMAATRRAGKEILVEAHLGVARISRWAAGSKRMSWCPSGCRGPRPLPTI